MSRPQFILCHDTAKLARGDRTDVFLELWDDKWKEFALFPHIDAGLTPANLRGLVRRNMATHGYTAEILNDEVPTALQNRDTGVTFRFHETPRHQLPDHMRNPLQLDLFNP